MRTLLQSRDLFFMSHEFYEEYHHQLKKEIIVPKEEFVKHSIYNNIHASSCYYTWDIKYQYVLVTEEGWYEKQTKYFKHQISKEQMKNNSAMIDGENIITINYWNHLSEERKRILTNRFNDRIHGIDTKPFPDDFMKFNNVFPMEETFRRHKNKVVDFGEEEMKRWYLPQDLLRINHEIIFTDNQTQEDVISIVLSDSGIKNHDD